jgi:hypothetical protein
MDVALQSPVILAVKNIMKAMGLAKALWIDVHHTKVGSNDPDVSVPDLATLRDAIELYNPAAIVCGGFVGAAALDVVNTIPIFNAGVGDVVMTGLVGVARPPIPHVLVHHLGWGNYGERNARRAFDEFACGIYRALVRKPSNIMNSGVRVILENARERWTDKKTAGDVRASKEATRVWEGRERKRLRLRMFRFREEELESEFASNGSPSLSDRDELAERLHIKVKSVTANLNHVLPNFLIQVKIL